MLIIPFNDAGSWREQIQLDNIIYFLNFTWNALNEFWVMDIYNRNEEPLILGIKIVPNYPLLAQFTVQGMPPGEIICQNIVNTPDEIKRFDIGQKFELVYYFEGELEALIEAQADAI